MVYKYRIVPMEYTSRASCRRPRCRFIAHCDAREWHGRNLCAMGIAALARFNLSLGLVQGCGVDDDVLQG